MGGEQDDGAGLGTERLAAARVLIDEAPAVAEEWRELCRWDPELAPDTVPPPVEPVIAAVTRTSLARFKVGAEACPTP